MNKTNLQRYVWIDYAKSLGIFLIVYGHGEITNFEFHFLWTFHVPLFFLLSGFLSGRNPGQLDLGKKINRLLLPYIYIYLISVCTSYTIRFLVNQQFNIVNFGKSLLGVFWGNDSYSYFINSPLWFLPSLLTVELIFNIVNRKLRWLLLVCLGISIFLYTHSIVMTFLSIDLSLVGLNYYILGYALKKQNIINKLEKQSHLVLMLIIISSLAIVFVLAKNNNIWYTGKSIPAYLISFIGGSVGCIMILGVSMLLAKIIGELKLITHISQNTLLILGFHFYSNKFTYYIFSLFTFMPSTSRKLLAATLSILILIPIIMLTNKFVPQIGGRKGIKPIKI